MKTSVKRVGECLLVFSIVYGDLHFTENVFMTPISFLQKFIEMSETLNEGQLFLLAGLWFKNGNFAIQEVKVKKKKYKDQTWL